MALHVASSRSGPAEPVAAGEAARPRPAANAPSVAAADPQSSTSAQLIRLEGELRRCTSAEALWQHLANEPVALLPFGQALVFEGAPAGRWRVAAISGLASVNRDAPLVRWYENMVTTLCRPSPDAPDPLALRTFDVQAYADPDDPCSADAVLTSLLWVPLADVGQTPRAGWLLARDQPWDEAHMRLAGRLGGAYAHGLSAIAGRSRPVAGLRRHRSKLLVGVAVLVAALAFVHVPLTTLAPVEVTPQDPFVVTAALPAVVERILVPPGAQVAAGTPLVQLVDTQLRSDYEVAIQKVEVARAKVLRLQQAAVSDPTAKRELAVAQSEESVATAERDYARAMLAKAVLRAPQDGVALYGDPRDWLGRPVAVGEAIMRVADPNRVQYQLKVPVADSVNLHEGAAVRVFLDAAPLDPLDAQVVRVAYRADADAAGVSSYTVLARVNDPTAVPERLGLRGTARVYGEPVSLFYYLLRRPITALRQWTGV
ncbi:MAG: HlyD family efflux transporter periplasmic adaptor subunit [Achromobacter sp.]|uniref:efflux RND transporter periplasmic adaptor subunit n=1 Tax=Achromobacter sp. TaxID=134375 RepID=UPI0029AC0DA8|nr:HlyD family efflux transporter periplasmic adaptor subunit [Achromobacter sp.]MDX3987855.1 HlyD family efflux transporter periplasmic adaptor subunit [Achromobacter sp.]